MLASELARMLIDSVSKYGDHPVYLGVDLKIADAEEIECSGLRHYPAEKTEEVFVGDPLPERFFLKS